MFGFKKKENSSNDNINKHIDVTHVYSNDYLKIVSDACSVCWDKTPPDTTEGRIDYIYRRIKTGHTSILEHSNIVMLVFAEKNEYTMEKFLDFASTAKFLNTKVFTNNNNVYMVVGGSLRGYFDMLDKMYHVYNTNPIVYRIIDVFYSYSYKELFREYIDLGIMNEHNFSKDPAVNYHFSSDIDYNTDSDKVDVMNVDSVNHIYKVISSHIESNPGDNFTYTDLLDFATVTILFKNMSRNATHQLVRHRNAITQESQRYVDYSNAKFVNPADSIYREDLHDVKYKLSFNGVEAEYTLQELGDEICKLYPQLIDLGFRREEARAFLPSNVACGKLHMTFTISNFIKFLYLRRDKAAQGEIRNYADIARDYVKRALTSVGEFDVLPEYDGRKVFEMEDSSSYDSVDEKVD